MPDGRLVSSRVWPGEGREEGEGREGRGRRSVRSPTRAGGESSRRPRQEEGWHAAVAAAMLDTTCVCVRVCERGGGGGGVHETGTAHYAAACLKVTGHGSERFASIACIARDVLGKDI